MKTKIITLVSLMILTVTITGKVSAKSIDPKEMDKILKKEISYPDFARQQKLEGIVLVNFSVNPDGTIAVNLTNQSDASLKDYVVSKLKQLRIIPSKGISEKTYNVKFNFRFEK